MNVRNISLYYQTLLVLVQNLVKGYLVSQLFCLAHFPIRSHQNILTPNPEAQT